MGGSKIGLQAVKDWFAYLLENYWQTHLDAALTEAGNPHTLTAPSGDAIVTSRFLKQDTNPGCLITAQESAHERRSVGSINAAARVPFSVRVRIWYSSKNPHDTESILNYFAQGARRAIEDNWTAQADAAYTGAPPYLNRLAWQKDIAGASLREEYDTTGLVTHGRRMRSPFERTDIIFRGVQSQEQRTNFSLP